MTESTYRLQETLIRLLKGCIKAWETWLREQKMRGLKIEMSVPRNSDSTAGGV